MVGWGSWMSEGVGWGELGGWGWNEVRIPGSHPLIHPSSQPSIQPTNQLTCSYDVTKAIGQPTRCVYFVFGSNIVDPCERSDESGWHDPTRNSACVDPG